MNELNNDIKWLMSKKKQIVQDIEEKEGEELKILEIQLEEIEDELEEKKNQFKSLWEFRRITDEFN